MSPSANQVVSHTHLRTSLVWIHSWIMAYEDWILASQLLTIQTTNCEKMISRQNQCEKCLMIMKSVLEVKTEPKQNPAGIFTVNQLSDQ